MADVSRKAQLTAELLRLSQQQTKALENAVYLGWEPGALEAYQERGATFEKEEGVGQRPTAGSSKRG
jgi:hypothetical protein